MPKGWISASWGPYGGFYFKPRCRLCLGWLAFTWGVGVEIDDLIEAWADRADELELDKAMRIGGLITAMRRNDAIEYLRKIGGAKAYERMCNLDRVP